MISTARLGLFFILFRITEYSHVTLPALGELELKIFMIQDIEVQLFNNIVLIYEEEYKSTAFRVKSNKNTIE